MKIPNIKFQSPTKADNSSVAISGDNFAPININTGLADTQYSEIQKTLQSLQSQLLDSSETKVRDQIDQVLNNLIDSYIKFIESNKPLTALHQFEELLQQLKPDTSGKIRFRVKANIGVCHYILGDENKAADYLLEAYKEEPNEPKAIANKVLALLLKRKAIEAYEFGKEELLKDETNETLAGYLIQSARLIPKICDPLKDIPKSLKQKPSVFVGRIHYLQHRGKNGEWWKIAHTGFKKYPNDKELKYYSAQAITEQILSLPDVQKSFVITEKQYSDLMQATEVLLEKWKLRCSGEGPLREDDQILGTNLLNIFYFLNDITNLKDVLIEATAKSTNDVRYLQCLAQHAVQFGEILLAEKAIEGIKQLEGSEFICFQIAQANGDDKYLSEVSDFEIEKFPLPERKAYKLVKNLSKFVIGNIKPTEEDLDRLVEIADNGIRELLLISHAAEGYQLGSYSEKIYQKAISNLKENSHITSKIMLARQAYHRKDWHTVIECLDGSISRFTDSEELRYLASAFANETPVLKRAITFFQEVINRKIDIPHIHSLYGTALYNQGAIKQAIPILRKELQRDSNDLYTLITLLNSYARNDDQTKIKDLLENIDPYILEGNPIHQMHLAQLLKKYNQGALAYEFGYSVLCQNPNSEKVITMYFGLIMIAGIDELIPSSEVVTEGYCIKLQNKTGTVFEYLFDDSKVSHIPPKNLNHPLIQNSIGLKINSSFEQKRGDLPPVVWQVVEIKHKYLHALHAALEKFETEFPNSKAIYKIDLPEEENIDALLNTIKIQSEKKDQTLNKYLENRFPIAMIARLLGKEHTTITAAETLVQANHKIYSNYGAREYLSAHETISNHKFSAVILDTYTAWHVALLDLLPLLKNMFHKVVISQSTIDDLNSLLTDTDSFYENESMSIGWKDGEFQKYVMTLEDHQKREKFIKSQRDKLLEICEVELIELDVVPNELVSMVTKIAGIQFWEPAILANQPDRILLSEDVFYRQWASQGLHLDYSTWTDPVLRYAFDKGLISLENLSNYLIHFAQWNHTSISLDQTLLLKALEIDSTTEIVKFGSLCKYIGSEGSDFREHLILSKETLKSIWHNPSFDDFKKKKSTKLILENLLRFATKKAQIIIALCHDSSDEMSDCIIDWRENNGIDDDEMSKAYIELFQNLDHIDSVDA